jgi:dihydrofolate reductase
VVTEIDADFEGDAFAPQFGPEWVETSQQQQLSSTGLSLRFVTYQKSSGV